MPSSRALTRSCAIVLLLFAFTLGGCASQIMEASKQACAEFGFTPGTLEFAQCTQTEFQQRRALLSAASSRSRTPAAFSQVPTPRMQTIFTGDGRMITCNTYGNIATCF